MASPNVVYICSKIADCQKQNVAVLVGTLGPKQIQYTKKTDRFFKLVTIVRNASGVRAPIKAPNIKFIIIDKRILPHINYFADQRKTSLRQDSLDPLLANDLNELYYIAYLVCLTAEALLAIEKEPTTSNHELLKKVLREKGAIRDCDEFNKEFFDNLQKGEITGRAIMPILTKCISVSSPQEVELLKDIVLPPMFSNAAEINNVDTMKSLKSSGINFSIKDSNHRTALHVAASNGNLETVEYLLSIGINVHIQDKLGYNALACAVNAKAMDCIVAIKRAGGVVDAKEQKIGVDLCLAVYQNDMELLKCNHAAGVDMGAKDYGNRTALHVAVSLNKPEMVEYLLDIGLDPNEEDDMGMTPIGEAKRRKFKDLETLMNAH